MRKCICFINFQNVTCFVRGNVNELGTFHKPPICNMHTYVFSHKIKHIHCNGHIAGEPALANIQLFRYGN